MNSRLFLWTWSTPPEHRRRSCHGRLADHWVGRRGGSSSEHGQEALGLLLLLLRLLGLGLAGADLRPIGHLPLGLHVAWVVRRICLCNLIVLNVHRRV